MVDVIYGHAIKQEQVLVGTTTANVHARRAFRSVLHAWQQLDGFQHVSLAKQGRDAFDLLHGQLHHAHLRTARAHRGAGAFHNHLVQGRVGLKQEVKAEVLLQVEGTALLGIAHIRDLQLHLALVQGQSVEAITICCTAFS